MGSGGSPGAILLTGGAPRLEAAVKRRGWLRPGVAATLVGAAAALVALPGGTAGRTTTARRGLMSLPAAAQGPVSFAGLQRRERTHHRALQRILVVVLVADDRTPIKRYSA
jgi:hypothetical protein